MEISFVGTSAYLPEFVAYKEYCTKLGIKTTFVNESSEIPNSSDVIWRLCGIQRHQKRINSLTVHEYQSLSLPPFSIAKDLIKSCLNTTPDLRLFLNSHIRDSIHFYQERPYFIRDMGVHKNFLRKISKQKDYKFLYIGVLSEKRGSYQMLEKLTETGQKVLVVGEPPRDLARARNIEFTGKIEYLDVANFAQRAEYGVNYILDRYPFNKQTSTKLLEYCALGLKIISTDYEWVKQFEQSRDGRFFYINKKINMNELESFEFRIPKVDDLEWNQVLSKCGVFEEITRLYNGNK